MSNVMNDRGPTELKPVAFDAVMLADQVLQENKLLATKIETALGSDNLTAVAALREVMRFLFLVSKQKTGRLTPSQRVDIAWHEFILFTRAYHRFCDSYFGRFIHHDPGGSSEVNRKQFLDTLCRYKQYFGTPDARFWCTSLCDADCGACESI